MNKNKTIVGLTGKSGAGKSTVARIFKQYGFFVIDADRVAREITSMPKTAKILSEHFGHEILDGEILNRKALAKIVFSDKTQLQKLNNLLFPIIYAQIQSLIASSKNRYILLDAPQLFESGLNETCGIIVSVVAPHNTLIYRIMSRDGISKEDAEKRLASQLSEEFFKDRSDYVIYSDSTIDAMKRNTATIIESIIDGGDVFEL